MKKNPHKIWEPQSIWRQLMIVFLVVFTALLFVTAIDLFTHPGRSWNETTLIKMIIERRSQD